MPCTVDISERDEINHFQIMLCQACKYLKADQINSLSGEAGLSSGLSWYSRHLMNDYTHACKKDILGFNEETSEEEKKKILNELSRIGYHLIIKENSMELVRRANLY